MCIVYDDEDKYPPSEYPHSYESVSNTFNNDNDVKGQMKKFYDFEIKRWSLYTLYRQREWFCRKCY